MSPYIGNLDRDIETSLERAMTMRAKDCLPKMDKQDLIATFCAEYHRGYITRGELFQKLVEGAGCTDYEAELECCQTYVVGEED